MLSSEPQAATAGSAAVSSRQAEIAAIAGQLHQLAAVQPATWSDLKAEWTFALGSPGEGLNTSLSSLPAKLVPVTLPHRLLEPDTPYWYVADVALPGDSVFAIGADDGAQLYVDGRRIPAYRGVFFVPGSSAKSHVVVRVINKAMAGGLGDVHVAARADYDRYRSEADLRARLDALVNKLVQLPAPTAGQVDAVRRAVGAPSAETVSTAETSLSSSPIVIVEPYLQTTSADAMTVAWETDVPCRASVEWGEGSALVKRQDAKSEGTLHFVQMKPLSPGATYSYIVRSGPDVSRQYTFKALPAGDTFDFAAWSDLHTGDSGVREPFRANLANMQRLPLAFEVSVGDVVVSGSDKAPWITMFESLHPLAAQVPTMFVGGNHEYDGCFEDLRCVHFERYARTTPTVHYYAWSAGNARFVALDPNIYFPTGIPVGSAERTWFLREIESNDWKQAKWHFVFIHQPPFSQGWTGYHGDLPIRELLEPLIEKYGIDFVVSGHTHDYERWTKAYGAQKVHYLIVGGAGGGLEDGPLSDYPVMETVIRKHHVAHFRVAKDHVDIEAIGTDGQVLDQFAAVK